jgi:hypothetical protein
LRKKGISAIVAASVVLIALAIMASSLLLGTAPGSSQGNDINAESSDGPLELSLREDLNGAAIKFTAGQPIFLALEEGGEAIDPSAVTLRVEAARASDVQVRIFGPGGLSSPWEPSEVDGGVQGRLPAAEGRWNSSSSVIVGGASPLRYCTEQVASAMTARFRASINRSDPSYPTAKWTNRFGLGAVTLWMPQRDVRMSKIRSAPG